jgi:hypothetical protein
MKEMQKFVILAVLVKETGGLITVNDIDHLTGDNPLGSGFAGLDFKVEIADTTPLGNSVTRIGKRAVAVRNWLTVESGEPTGEILEALRAGHRHHASRGYHVESVTIVFDEVDEVEE